MNIVKILIFNLNSFRNVLSFSSLGIELHILEPTAAAVSIPYITVRMFRGLDLKKKKNDMGILYWQKLHSRFPEQASSSIFR